MGVWEVGAGGGFLLMYLEGSWGIKAPPTPAAWCVVFGGCLGESRGRGRREGLGGRHGNTGCFLRGYDVPGTLLSAKCAGAHGPADTRCSVQAQSFGHSVCLY